MARLKAAEKFVFKLHLNALTDGEIRIFRDVAFQICGAV